MNDLPLVDTPDKPSVLTDLEQPSKAHLRSARAPRVERRPASIEFVKSRMLYGRASVNNKGKVAFGLRHIRMPLCMLREMKY